MGNTWDYRDPYPDKRSKEQKVADAGSTFYRSSTIAAFCYGMIRFRKSSYYKRPFMNQTLCNTFRKIPVIRSSQWLHSNAADFNITLKKIIDNKFCSICGYGGSILAAICSVESYYNGGCIDPDLFWQYYRSKLYFPVHGILLSACFLPYRIFQGLAIIFTFAFCYLLREMWDYYLIDRRKKRQGRYIDR